MLMVLPEEGSYISLSLTVPVSSLIGSYFCLVVSPLACTDAPQYPYHVILRAPYTSNHGGNLQPDVSCLASSQCSITFQMPSGNLWAKHLPVSPLEVSMALSTPTPSDVPKIYFCISTKFSGESQTKWHTKRSGGITNSAREVYYVKSEFILGNGSDSEELIPGEHVYPFSFKLPLNIPSSYETFTGQVRHQCRAKLHLSSGYEDKVVVRPFSVNTLYDLNLDDNAKLPVEKKCEKRFPLSTGSMSITLLLARTGFVPGEKLRIHLEFHNDSTRNVKCIKLKFIKDAIYHASGGATKHYTMTLAKLWKNDITAPGTQVIWSNTGPIVPALPPSYLQYCNIIDMRYKLEITLFPSGFSKKIKLEQPIIIGSIPLSEHFSLYRMIYSHTHSDEDPYTSGATSAALPASPRTITSSSNSNNHPRAPQLTNSDDPPPYDPNWMDDGGEPASAPVFPAFGGESPSAPVFPGLSGESPSTPVFPGLSGESPSAPVFPGFDNYPEMPPPSYIESLHSVHIRHAANSNGTPQNPFIPSYIIFNANHSRPSTPTVSPRHLQKLPQQKKC